jgi:cobalamin-dependent methionine synthase I
MPPARHVLNSVILDHAVQRGITGAIVHSLEDPAAAQGRRLKR